ncbi:MAG TPA: diacylglycerol kinase family protein [Flavisolibacter sp.]|nr:diacylglycerol kinase family protein [Flavisolibacter sp.]
MRHLLYIINPISGTRNKQSVQQLVEEKTKAAGFSYSIHHSVASGDYTFLHPIIAKEKATDIIIAAGDGTVNQVINGLKELDVQFGILPCGSGNGLAFSAGISKDLEKALENIFKGESQPTDAFLVNDSFACMLCGIGFDAQVAHDFAQAPTRGLNTYIQKTVSNFFTAKPYPFHITMEGGELEKEAFFISIANSNQFGNNFTIAPKASLTDGLLDIVVVTKQNKASMLVQMIRQVGGFNYLVNEELAKVNKGILYFQTDALTINNASGAPMHIDGDPVETATQLEIRMLKHCFRLICP